jgi:hypothetical protein
VQEGDAGAAVPGTTAVAENAVAVGESRSRSRSRSRLKVPKRDNFLLALFALSEPIWVCDIRTAKKIEFFYQLTPILDCFWFFAAYKKKIFEAGPVPLTFLALLNLLKGKSRL